MNKAWAIPDELLERTDLDMTEKVLLAILDRLGGQERVVWPRHQWLAARMGVSDRTIRRVLTKLQERGVVEQHDRRWKIATYSLTGQYVRFTGQCVRPSPDNVSGDSPDNVSAHKKDIQSKDIQIKHSRVGHTPKEEAEEFFSSKEKQLEVVAFIVNRGIPESLASKEVDKFVDYWTEPNGTGTKERWQMEKTFDVQRRLKTWFSRVNGFYRPNSQDTGRRIV